MSNTATEERPISPNKAGQLLGVSGQTVRRLVEDGALPATVIRNHVLIKTSDILSYQEKCKFQPIAAKPAANPRSRPKRPAKSRG